VPPACLRSGLTIEKRKCDPKGVQKQDAAEPQPQGNALEVKAPPQTPWRARSTPEDGSFPVCAARDVTALQLPGVAAEGKGGAGG